MVEFSRASNLKIRLVYYPPYHSKYNLIERYWAYLENFWNGAILDSIEIAIAWAENIRWMRRVAGVSLCLCNPSVRLSAYWS
jgi:hypothetical protein